MTRKLHHCPNCSPNKNCRAIFDCDTARRVRVCRACGHSVPMRAISQTILAKRAQRQEEAQALWDALFDENGNLRPHSLTSTAQKEAA